MPAFILLRGLYCMYNTNNSAQFVDEMDEKNYSIFFANLQHLCNITCMIINNNLHLMDTRETLTRTSFYFNKAGNLLLLFIKKK